MNVKRLALLATVPVAVLLSGCGGATIAAPSSPTVASNAAQSGKGLPKVGASVAASELGARMTKAEEAEKTVTIDASGSNGGGTSQFDMSSKPYVAAMHVVSPSSMDLVIVDGTKYVKAESLKSVLPAGKTWAGLPNGSDNELVQLMNVVIEPLVASALIGPYLQELGPLPVKVTGSTEASISYEVTVTEEQEIAALKAMTSDPSVYDRVPKGSVGSATMKITVDGASLPTKVVLTNKLGTRTATFRDWGKPVNIVPPPAAQTETLK